MILGLGNDITECERIENVLKKFGDSFLQRVLTAREQEESCGKLSYYAGHWAAKEAVSKALGCGIGKDCSFTDIEILHDPAGRPVTHLSGAAADTMRRLGGTQILVSISHERHYAAATAVIEKI